MRYSLTLPIALAALAAAPAIAQDAAPPAPVEATDPATPPADPVSEPPADMPTPPAEDTTATDEAATPPAPTDMAPATPPPAEPVAPEATETATPTTATAPASLSAEQKAAYDTWPAEAQSYFNTLSPARQELFLRITDADKVKIVGLDTAQQEQVWTSLEQQAASQKAEAPAEPTAPGK